jgi:hypothetical protein
MVIVGLALYPAGRPHHGFARKPANSPSSRGRRFLGCKRIDRHPQELRHEPVGTLPLALKIGAVTGCTCF